MLEQPGTLRTHIDRLFIYHQTPTNKVIKVLFKDGKIDSFFHLKALLYSPLLRSPTFY